MAVLGAVLMMAATVGVVLAHHPANDGQRLSDQPPEVQALYLAVHGVNADARWVAEHNAALGPAPTAPGDPMAHPRYMEVHHVAYVRSGSLDLARRITESVIARGTVQAFMAGMDMGVLYGYVAPAPQPRAAPSSSSSSSSTSSGPSSPKSPSTSTVTGWGEITRNWLVGQKVTLTLPSSNHPGVDGYALADDGSLPDGLEFSASKRTVSGTPTAPTTSTFSNAYSAQDGGSDIGAPFVLTLRINVRDADLQPTFRSRSQDSISIVEGGAVSGTLPEVIGGNTPIEYSVSGLPEGAIFTDTSRVLSGTPTEVGRFSVTYKATDQDGDSASLTFTITVEKDIDPEAPSIGDMTFTQGEKVGRYLPEGSKGNGNLTYTLEDQPAGLAFNVNTRWLGGTIADDATPGRTVVTYTVTDTGGSDTDTEEFTITIKAKS